MRIQEENESERIKIANNLLRRHYKIEKHEKSLPLIRMTNDKNDSTECLQEFGQSCSLNTMLL
jgi:hypothetical protein